MIINQRLQYHTLTIAERIKRRCIQVTPAIDKKLKIHTKQSCIPSCFLCKTLTLSVFVGHPHLLLCSTFFVRCIKSVATLLIVSIDFADLIGSIFYLSDEFSVEIIKVQMHVTITVTG